MDGSIGIPHDPYNLPYRHTPRHSRETDMHILTTYQCMTNYFKCPFFPQTHVACNALPKSVVTSSSLDAFTNEDTNQPACEIHPVDTPCPDLKLTHEQVHDELRSLNESKSPGPDHLHPKVLRETADTITAPLLTIYQHSLDTGEVPETRRRARVTAIYKKGSRNDPGNYRPVSLTSICCKVLEKLIRHTLVKHMSQNNQFTKEQHGFLGGRFCITQLLSGLEEWTDALDKGWLSTRFTSILPKHLTLCHTDDWWQSSNPTRFPHS